MCYKVGGILKARYLILGALPNIFKLPVNGEATAMKIRLFDRCPENPIISPLDMPFQAAGVLNPGATQHGDEVLLLLRVEDHAGYSNIHIAHSKNGVDSWEIESEPFLRHGESRWRYEQWGCEDARLTYLSEEKCWYITYTAYSPAGAAVALARTEDFKKVERIGLIFSPNNKDAVLFPKKFGERWGVLHRPDAGGIEHIWSAYSPDLVHWGEPHCVLPELAGPAWDGVKVGAGPPPILTEHGWLLIYHGVKAYGGHLVSLAGVVLLYNAWPTRRLLARETGFFRPKHPTNYLD